MLNIAHLDPWQRSLFSRQRTPGKEPLLAGKKFLQFVLKKKDAAIMQIRLCADQYLEGSSLGPQFVHVFCDLLCIVLCIFLRVTQTELSPNQKQQSTKDSHSHSLKKSSINAIDHVEQLHLSALFSLSEANPCPNLFIIHVADLGVLLPKEGSAAEQVMAFKFFPVYDFSFSQV